jgi:hypothetical protein
MVARGYQGERAWTLGIPEPGLRPKTTARA